MRFISALSLVATLLGLAAAADTRSEAGVYTTPLVGANHGTWVRPLLVRERRGLLGNRVLIGELTRVMIV